jgi:hypothetical protein
MASTSDELRLQITENQFSDLLHVTLKDGQNTGAAYCLHHRGASPTHPWRRSAV